MNCFYVIAIVLVILLCYKIAFDLSPDGYEDSEGFHRDGR